MNSARYEPDKPFAEMWLVALTACVRDAARLAACGRDDAAALERWRALCAAASEALNAREQ